MPDIITCDSDIISEGPGSISELLAHSCRCRFLSHVLEKCWGRGIGSIFLVSLSSTSYLAGWKAVFSSVWFLKVKFFLIVGPVITISVV